MAFIRATVQSGGSILDPGATDAATKAVYREQLMGAGLYLQGKLNRGTPFGVTGAAQKGWFTFYDGIEQEATVTNPLEYLLPLEVGRKPAWVPIKPLTLWVVRKLGVSDQKTAKGIAFVISRKKSRQATPGQGFVRRIFEESLPDINAHFLEPIGAELVRRLA